MLETVIHGPHLCRHVLDDLSSAAQLDLAPGCTGSLLVAHPYRSHSYLGRRRHALARADPDTPPRRDAQGASGLMESLRGSGAAATAAQVAAAHRLAAAIEAAEGRFAAAAGDLAFNAVQRTDFDVGRLLAAIRACRDEYEEVAEHWTRDGRHGAQLPQVRSCLVS